MSDLASTTSPTRMVLLSKGTVPTGGYFRYRDPDAEFEVAHPYYEWCKAKAHDGRTSRGLAIPHNWDEFFDDQVCRTTPQACREIPGTPHEPNLSWLQMAAQFSKAVAGWLASGARITSYEQLKARQVICAGDETTPRCPYFGRFPVFGLTKCGKCGCSGLKLYMANQKCPADKWGPV